MNPESQTSSLQTELTEYCQAHHLTKFAPEEIVELLKDGEAVDWLMSMLVPAEQQSQHARLVELLTSLRQEVYQEPPPTPSPETMVETAPETTAAETPEEPPMDDAELEKMAMSMLPPGVDPRQFKKFMSSPQAALMGDFALFCQERGVDVQNVDGGKIPDEIRALQDEWMQTPRETLEGKTPAELLGGRSLIPQKVETVRRTEPKVGRNDPCPCGSGKKYKKCHGAGIV
jgi:SEC-C motif